MNKKTVLIFVVAATVVSLLAFYLTNRLRQA